MSDSLSILKKLLTEVDEKYLTRVADPYNRMNSIEVYVNPTGDDFRELAKGESGELRFFIDFSRKKVYAWDGSVLHPAVAQSGEIPNTKHMVMAMSRTDYPDELDIAYFDVGGEGYYENDKLPAPVLKKIARVNWEWLELYFTNVDEAKAEFTQSLKGYASAN